MEVVVGPYWVAGVLAGAGVALWLCYYMACVWLLVVNSTDKYSFFSVRCCSEKTQRNMSEWVGTRCIFCL
jgi:hypothetical protein